MTINKTTLSTSLLLAIGLSVSAFAQTETAPATEPVAIECIPQAEVDAMTDEDKGKLTLPVCEAENTEEAVTPAQ